MSTYGAVTALDEAAHLSPGRVIARYRSFDSICWAGEGAYQYSNLIRESALELNYQFSAARGSVSGWRIAEPASNLAQHVASLAWARHQVIEDPSPTNLRAIYVRPSDAELKV
jgi:hypothetical protein